MTAYYTSGFDTATNTVVDAINKLRDTNVPVGKHIIKIKVF